MLAAGIDLEHAYDYDSRHYNAWHEACRYTEKEFSKNYSFDFVVLANTLPTDRTWVYCKVYDHEPLEPNTISNINIHCADEAPEKDWDVRRAIVIPHGGIEYDLAAQNADVIITEVGGKLCHLATVSREKGKLMIRVDNAIERFPTFTKMEIDIENMKITLPYRFVI